MHYTGLLILSIDIYKFTATTCSPPSEDFQLW